MSKKLNGEENTVSDKLNDEKLRDIAGGTGGSGTYNRNPGGVCFNYTCEGCGGGVLCGVLEADSGICHEVSVEHVAGCGCSVDRCGTCSHRVGDAGCSIPNNF